MSKSILVIEDDRFLQANLVKVLEAEGYSASGVTSGEEGLASLEQSQSDMVVLDLGLPGMDGLTTCRRIRAKWRMPILMLTARTDAMDKVLGLETGADDYLTKPFDSGELVARVRAQLRRSTDYLLPKEPKTDTLDIGELRIDFSRRRISVEGAPIELTTREYEIVAYLAKNSGRAISRDQLFETIWGYELDLNNNSLDVYMYRIRKKLETDPDCPKYVHTMRGYGFKLGLED